MRWRCPRRSQLAARPDHLGYGTGLGQMRVVVVGCWTEGEGHTLSGFREADGQGAAATHSILPQGLVGTDHPCPGPAMERGDVLPSPTHRLRASVTGSLVLTLHRQTRVPSLDAEPSASGPYLPPMVVSQGPGPSQMPPAPSA